jgi:hypothetical protein
MDNIADNPAIILEIKPEGVFEFWSHIAVVDGIGRTSFQQVLDNAAVVALGSLESLKDSILNITGSARDMGNFDHGIIHYSLMYAGTQPQTNSVTVDATNRGIFGFSFKFCPRYPFC